MKSSHIILLALVSVLLANNIRCIVNNPLQSKCNCNSPNTGADAPPPLRNTSAPTFEDLLDAIEWVESKGYPNAIGDGGKAAGDFQIHKIYVDDVNRILKIGWAKSDKLQKQALFAMNFKGDITYSFLEVDGKPVRSFTYNDRWGKVKSRAMASVYLWHYGGTF